MKDIYYNAVIHAKKGMDVDTMGVENGRVAFIEEVFSVNFGELNPFPY